MDRRATIQPDEKLVKLFLALFRRPVSVLCIGVTRRAKNEQVHRQPKPYIVWGISVEGSCKDCVSEWTSRVSMHADHDDGKCSVTDRCFAHAFRGCPSRPERHGNVFA